MATRKINTFIEHLMNEAMTAAGTVGGGTKNVKGAGKTSTRSATDSPLDQSTEDGKIIPYFKPFTRPEVGDPASPDAMDPRRRIPHPGFFGPDGLSYPNDTYFYGSPYFYPDNRR